MNCKNCNAAVHSNFCPNCGQPTKLKRIDGHYIIHEIEHILHFERGILFSVKELFLRPGETIRRFIAENRSRLVKPVIFIIVTSLIYTIVSRFSHTDYNYIRFQGVEKLTLGKILKWIQGNYGYANILTGAFIAFWLKIFFKKYNYNFFEILIMLCYVMGMQMLIFALFALVNGFVSIKLEAIAGIFGLSYLVWAAGNFFEKNKIGNYAIVLLSYLLGTIIFYAILFGIGIGWDTLMKH